MTRTVTRTVTRPGLVAPKPKVKHRNNVYTVLLFIAFAFIVTAIVFNEMDLTTRYGMEWTKTIWPF